MIEFLTPNKLEEYGFDKEVINRLLTWDNYPPHSLQNNNGSFWACNKENKIYSGIDALRKIYFSNENSLYFPYNDLNLVPEYYELALHKYLKDQRELAGIIFVEKTAIEKFRLEQIEHCNNVISHYSNLLKGRSFQNIIKKTKAYLDWLNQLQDIEQPVNNNTKLKIASELIGLTGDYNSSKTVQPCFHYIKEILNKHQITPLTAKEYLNDLKGAFSPDWNKNVIPAIMDYLKEVQPNNSIINSNNTPQHSNSNEPTLKELALYYYYLGQTVTKENSMLLLKDTKHTSGAKLKQNYDFYYKTTNRINLDGERKNNHRLKEFGNVIKMLTKVGNELAIQKATSEFQLFKNKVE